MFFCSYDLRKKNVLIILKKTSMVVGFDLEVGLGMVADGTYLGSLLAYDDVTAVGTLPDDITVL